MPSLMCSKFTSTLSPTPFTRSLQFSMLVHTELGKINTSMRERMTGVEECLKSMADLIHGQQKTMTAVLAELSMDNGGGGGIGSSSPNLKNSLNRKRFAASSPGAQSPLVGMSIRATSQSELLVRSVSKMSLGRGEEERHGELVSSP